MLRRVDLILLGVFVVATIIAGIAGSRASRGTDMFEFRASTEVNAPMGAKALALALERLGVDVERRRRPLFELGEGSAAGGPGELLVLLDLSIPPSTAEKRALSRYVERGGALFVGASSGVEGCFGVHVTRLRLGQETAPIVEGAVKPPGSVPRARAVLELLPPASLDSEQEDCPLQPIRTDTLLTTADGRSLSMRFWYDGGGRVTLLGDSQYLRNEVLKETEAGALFIPLLFGEWPRRVIFDEYHHGFGRRRSIWTAAWSWMLNTPAGWLLLQLLAVALFAVAVTAVRFGPALNVVVRERRSAIEHLDALAVGLQGARGWRTATTLIIEGLRRRLSRGATLRRLSEGNLQVWLDTLMLATASPEARAQVARLRQLAREQRGEEDVLDTALTVEKLWRALGK